MALGVAFAAIMPVAQPDAEWKGLPVPGSYMQMDPKPDITINWGVYVGIIGGLCAIAGSVLAWIQACALCSHIEEVRYRMLRKPITEEEEFGPAFKAVRMAPPVFQPIMEYGYSKPGIRSKPGMEIDF